MLHLVNKTRNAAKHSRRYWKCPTRKILYSLMSIVLKLNSLNPKLKDWAVQILPRTTFLRRKVRSKARKLILMLTAANIL